MALIGAMGWCTLLLQVESTTPRDRSFMNSAFRNLALGLVIFAIHGLCSCHHTASGAGQGVPESTQTPRANLSRLSGAEAQRTKSLLQPLRDTFVRTAVEKNVGERMRYYVPNAISMPEYQPTLEGADAISKYYEAIFSRQDVTRFERQMGDVFELEETIVELGSFRLEYTDAKSGETLRQEGKYWNVWARQPDGGLKIKAETWGYFQPIKDPAALTVEIAPGAARPSPRKLDARSEDLRFELHALNALMKEAVLNSDTELRLGFFTRDAVFMPHADSNKSGIDEIRKHLTEYNARNVVIDEARVETFDFERVGDGAIEYPRFNVKWRVPELSGVASGKGIRLWKRQPGGALKIFHEIATHDFRE